MMKKMSITTFGMNRKKLILACLISAFYLLAPVLVLVPLLIPIASFAQTATPGDETWRFRELEFLLYSETAEENLTQAQTSLARLEERLNTQFRASGLTRLSQYNCPSRISLPILDDNIDLNITTARLYQKYGHYFLCIRAFDQAMDTLSKSVPLYQTGYGRETLMQRSDPNYIIEARRFYDAALEGVMQLIEAAGAQQSYTHAQTLTNEYWPKRFDAGSEAITLRSNVINAWEDAIRLLNLLEMNLEEADARRRLRIILTFDAVN